MAPSILVHSLYCCNNRHVVISVEHSLLTCVLLQVHFHNVSSVAKQILPEVRNLQASLGQDHPYYEDAIFFLSLTLHKILPESVSVVISCFLYVKELYFLLIVVSSKLQYLKEILLEIGFIEEMRTT